jgi:hypothetical protein
MTEMNELNRSLDRVEELMHAKQYSGALTCLGISQNHALTAVKFIKDQAALLTKQQLEYISLFGELQAALEEKAVLVKDVEIQKERADMQYKRAVSAEAEIKELDELVQNIGELRKACEIAWAASPTIDDCVHWTNMVGVIDRYAAKLRGE